MNVDSISYATAIATASGTCALAMIAILAYKLAQRELATLSLQTKQLTEQTKQAAEQTKDLAEQTKQAAEQTKHLGEQVRKMQERHDPVPQELLVSEFLAYMELSRAMTHAVVAVRYHSLPSLLNAIQRRTEAVFGLELLWAQESPARTASVDFTRTLEDALRDLSKPEGDKHVTLEVSERVNEQYRRVLEALRREVQCRGRLRKYNAEIDTRITDSAIEEELLGAPADAPVPPESARATE